MLDVYFYARKGDLEGLKGQVGNVDINAGDAKDKYTPLMWAAKGGHLDVVDFLVHSVDGVDIDKKGGWNESTALMKAAEYDHLNVTKVLVEAGANINLANDYKSTALMLVAEKGHKSIAKYLVERNAFPDSQNELGYTAMILAAENGQSEILDILCNGGAKLDIANQFGKTAIIMAAEMNHIECVRILLRAGAKKDHQSKRGMTALMLATVKGNKDIVKLLLENKANVNLQNTDGETALINSFHPKDIELVKLLLANGADKTLRDKHGCTPLMVAAGKGRLDIVELFTNVEASQDLRADLNARSNDGSTALHFAAMKGHLNVVLHLIDNGADLKKKNYNEVRPIDALAKFYISGTEEQFKHFVKNIRLHCELLEMLPEIMPNMPQPTAYLNSCFTDLLMELKTAQELELVVGLVYLAVGIQLASKNHPLKAVELLDKLNTVNKMLVSCMGCESLDIEENVSLIFQDHAMRSRELKSKSSMKLLKARGFMEGPLCLCVKNELLPILGTRPVSVHVDKVFWSPIKEKPSRRIYQLKDFFQMRSNGVYWRTCPAVNFFLEGLSKLVVLILVGKLAIDVYDPNYYKSGDGRFLERCLVIMLTGHLLHELGELQDKSWVLSDYLEDIWNYLDLFSLALLTGWAALTWKFGDAAIAPAGAPVVEDDTEYWFPYLNAKACLIMSAIPMSFALLRYLSTFKGHGQLVLMTFAMMKDLGQFVVVFITSVLGFGIAFRGLFPTIEQFTSMERTILTLYDASLGQHDFSIFFEDPNHGVGVVMYVVYISMTMVVLLNLVIARFSATHDEINESSAQIWSMLKARFVQDFLLIEDRSPFCMLPPPLNIITIILIPLHFMVLYVSRLMNEDSQDGPKSVLDVLFEILTSCIYGVFNMVVTGIWLLKHLFLALLAFLDNFKETTKDGMKHYTPKSIIFGFFKIVTWLVTTTTYNIRNPKVAIYNLQKFGSRQFKTGLMYLKQHTMMDDRERRPYTVISICGTASDYLMSLAIIVPCAFYEIYLCIKDIKYQASSPTVYYICLSGFIIFFPFVVLAFIFTLLFEMFKARCILSIDENGESEIHYQVIENSLRKSTKPMKVDAKTSHLVLNVKIMRADFITKDYTLFSKPSLYAVIRIGSQELVTKMVDSLEMNPNFFENKDFILIFRENSSTMDKIFIAVYDNYHRVMGTTELSIERWVANGRFEGPLPLFINEQRTGTVNLVVKVMPKKKTDKPHDSITAGSDKNKTSVSNNTTSTKNQPSVASTPSAVPTLQGTLSRMESMKTRPIIFTDEDRERIFSAGVEGSSADNMTNFKDQLSELEDRLTEKMGGKFEELFETISKLEKFMGMKDINIQTKDKSPDGPTSQRPFSNVSSGSSSDEDAVQTIIPKLSRQNSIKSPLTVTPGKSLKIIPMHLSQDSPSTSSSSLLPTATVDPLFKKYVDITLKTNCFDEYPQLLIDNLESHLKDQNLQKHLSRVESILLKEGILGCSQKMTDTVTVSTELNKQSFDLITGWSKEDMLELFRLIPTDKAFSTKNTHPGIIHTHHLSTFHVFNIGHIWSSTLIITAIKWIETCGIHFNLSELAIIAELLNHEENTNVTFWKINQSKRELIELFVDQYFYRNKIPTTIRNITLTEEDLSEMFSSPLPNLSDIIDENSQMDKASKETIYNRLEKEFLRLLMTHWYENLMKTQEFKVGHPLHFLFIILIDMYCQLFQRGSYYSQESNKVNDVEPLPSFLTESIPPPPQSKNYGMFSPKRAKSIGIFVDEVILPKPIPKSSSADDLSSGIIEPLKDNNSHGKDLLLPITRVMNIHSHTQQQYSHKSRELSPVPENDGPSPVPSPRNQSIPSSITRDRSFVSYSSLSDDAPAAGASTQTVTKETSTSTEDDSMSNESFRPRLVRQQSDLNGDRLYTRSRIQRPRSASIIHRRSYDGRRNVELTPAGFGSESENSEGLTEEGKKYKREQWAMDLEALRGQVRRLMTSKQSKKNSATNGEPTTFPSLLQNTPVSMLTQANRSENTM